MHVTTADEAVTTIGEEKAKKTQSRKENVRRHGAVLRETHENGTNKALTRFLLTINRATRNKEKYRKILRRVALIRTNVTEELSASIIRVTRMSELGTTLAVTSNGRKRRSI
jgi:hypothetical protein